MARHAIKEGPDPIDIHVGSRVRARRTGLGISQTKLGDVLGVTFQQVQKYENGGNRIGASNLFRISKALDTNVDFFFEGMSDVTINAASGAQGLAETVTHFDHDPLTSKESIELVHNFYRITDEDVRVRLAKFVKALAQSKD